MKLTLSCLFGFLLCCAAVYYCSQFVIVENYGGVRGPGAEPRVS